jgi:predicted ArsR family transcriptional regulator
MTYPNSPGFQNTDTSEAAAAAIEPEAPNLRALVLRALSDRPATADECASEIGVSILAIRPRLTELRKLGSIEDTGQRRRNVSGRSAIVWRRAA